MGTIVEEAAPSGAIANHSLPSAIRGNMGVVERALRDVQLGVSEGRDVVRKTRGGLLKCRCNEFLHLQPPKLHGRPATGRPAPRPAVPLASLPSPQNEERMRQERQRLKAELQEQLRRGRPS